MTPSAPSSSIRQTSPALPLAAAQARLGRPGRPQKYPKSGHDVGIAASEPTGIKGATPRPTAQQASAHERRLLDLPAAALYLALSPWTLRELVAKGILRRVRVPLPNGGELRKVLLDREDLDQLIPRWKA
jgi:hypothetical protein